MAWFDYGLFFLPNPCDTPDMDWQSSGHINAAAKRNKNDYAAVKKREREKSTEISEWERKRETKMRENGPKKAYTLIDWIRISSIIKLIVQKTNKHKSRFRCWEKSSIFIRTVKTKGQWNKMKYQRALSVLSSVFAPLLPFFLMVQCARICVTDYK